MLYAYDALNRLSQVTDPAGEWRIYRYGAVGNILTTEGQGRRASRSVTSHHDRRQRFQHDAVAKHGRLEA